MADLKTPVCDRLFEVNNQIQACVGVLDWLSEKGIRLCDHLGGEWFPSTARRLDLIHEYFGIDPNALEQERRAILAHARGDGSYKAKEVR